METIDDALGQPYPYTLAIMGEDQGKRQLALLGIALNLHGVSPALIECPDTYFQKYRQERYGAALPAPFNQLSESELDDIRQAFVNRGPILAAQGLYEGAASELNRLNQRMPPGMQESFVLDSMLGNPPLHFIMRSFLAPALPENSANQLSGIRVGEQAHQLMQALNEQQSAILANMANNPLVTTFVRSLAANDKQTTHAAAINLLNEINPAMADILGSGWNLETTRFLQSIKDTFFTEMHRIFKQDSYTLGSSQEMYRAQASMFAAAACIIAVMATTPELAARAMETMQYEENAHAANDSRYPNRQHDRDEMDAHASARAEINAAARKQKADIRAELTGLLPEELQHYMRVITRMVELPIEERPAAITSLDIQQATSLALGLMENMDRGQAWQNIAARFIQSYAGLAMRYEHFSHNVDQNKPKAGHNDRQTPFTTMADMVDHIHVAQKDFLPRWGKQAEQFQEFAISVASGAIYGTLVSLGIRPTQEGIRAGLVEMPQQFTRLMAQNVDALRDQAESMFIGYPVIFHGLAHLSNNPRAASGGDRSVSNTMHDFQDIYALNAACGRDGISYA